jgi:N-methylhydantoinase B/oxoprolinase/acetone carboxylase alpha subunit
VKSDFITKAKKEMAKNYVAGNLNMQELIKSLIKTEGAAKDVEKLTKVSQQFKNLQFKSSKKLKDNKFKFEMEFNSNFNDKNIILQSLDLFSYLN